MLTLTSASVVGCAQLCCNAMSEDITYASMHGLPGLTLPQESHTPQCSACRDVLGKNVHMCMQSSSQVAPEEAIKTVQMVLAPSQGRPLPPVHLENVSLGLLLTPPQV